MISPNADVAEPLRARPFGRARPVDQAPGHSRGHGGRRRPHTARVVLVVAFGVG